MHRFAICPSRESTVAPILLAHTAVLAVLDTLVMEKLAQVCHYRNLRHYGHKKMRIGMPIICLPTRTKILMQLCEFAYQFS